MAIQLKPRSSPPRPAFTFSPPGSNHVELEPETSPPDPPAELIPGRDMHMFGTYPLRGAGEAGRGLLKCGRCGKVVLEWAFAEHKRESLLIATWRRGTVV